MCFIDRIQIKQKQKIEKKEQFSHLINFETKYFNEIKRKTEKL